MRQRILLADDHRILTEGLATLLSQHYDVVATARDGHELVFLAKENNPDVIITEIALRLLNSLDALQILRKAGLKSKFIVLTTHLDIGLAIEAFRAGVSGYVLKVAGKDEVFAAIEVRSMGVPTSARDSRLIWFQYSQKRRAGQQPLALS